MNFGAKVPRFKVVQTREEVEEIGIEFPIFARPAPLLPCHGFEESRVCHNRTELLAVWATVERHEGAELILMRPIDARCSGIWTNGTLSIGAGNDGATGGGAVVQFPTSDTPPVKGPYSTVPEGEFPFFELVCSSSKVYYVQLRSGPAIPRGRDWIPREMRVERIIRGALGDDLIAFADAIAGASDGTVVYVKSGGLSGHHGTHGKLNGLPVITSFEPAVGQVLQPTPLTPRANPRDAVHAFFTGVELALFGDPARTTLVEEEMNVLLSVARNYVHMDMSDPVQARWAGVAMGFMLSGGFAAAIGEARHALHVRRRRKLSREQVYVRVFQDFNRGRVGIHAAWNKFLNKSWRGGFGGAKWAACTAEVVALWNAIVALHQGKPNASIDRCAVQFNLTVDCVHNNGWWLNKFGSTTMFDKSAQVPCLPVIAAMRRLWDVAQVAPESIPHPSPRFKWRKVRDAWAASQAQLWVQDLKTRSDDMVWLTGTVQIRHKECVVEHPVIKLISRGVAKYIELTTPEGSGWTEATALSGFRACTVGHGAGGQVNVMLPYYNSGGVWGTADVWRGFT